MKEGFGGFRTDFTLDRGTWMVLEREGGLPSGEVAAIEARMVQLHRIPRLVPIEIAERDFQVTFRYQISGKRMLSQAAKGSRLTIHDYYALLLQAAAVLDDSRTYMLNERNYILHENYIFIGVSYGDAFFTYVPVREWKEKASLQDEFRSLATNMLGYVDEMSGTGVQELLHELRKDDFSAQRLKLLLAGLAAGGAAGGAPPGGLRAPSGVAPGPAGAAASPGSPRGPEPAGLQRPARERQAPASPQRSAGFAAAPPPAAEAARAAAAPWPQASSAAGLHAAAAAPPEPPEPAAPLTPLTQRALIYLLGGAALVLALIWRLYMAKPGANMLYICLGLTILLANGVFVYIKLWRPGAPLPHWLRRGQAKPQSRSFAALEEREGWMDEDVESRWDTPLVPAWSSAAAAGQRFKADSDSDFAEADRPETPRHSSQEYIPLERKDDPADDYYRELGRHTVLMSSPNADATVFLNAEGSSEARSLEKMPYLEVGMNGSVERIELREMPFTIGRIPGSAQYVAEGAGVSRTHLEIVRTDEGFAAKDLGSKNGSSLNGETMAAYKMYPLKNGDVIQVTKTEFTFRSVT